MKFHITSTARIVYIVAAGALSFGLAQPVHAELDYEFAKALIERDGGINTDDLVDRLIAQLEANAAMKSEVALIKATFKRQKARTFSDPAKALEYLQEAQRLYKEAATGGPTFRLNATAEKEAADIAKDILKTRRRAAKDNPAEAKKLSAEIAAEFQKVADEKKSPAETTYVKFKEVYGRYMAIVNENAKLDDAKKKKIPPELMKELDKVLDEWITADESYVLARIEQLEAYDDTDGSKKPLSEEMVKYTAGKLEQDDEMLTGFPNIAAFYQLMQGKAAAAVQNEEKAADAWGAVLTMDGGNLPPGQQRQLKALMRQCVHDLVKLKMKTKKYSDVEATITDAMMNQTVKTLFDEAGGKELMIDYAKALTIQSDDPQNFEKAVIVLSKLIKKEIDGAKGQRTQWANDFARTMAEILDDARTKKGAMPSRLGAEYWYDAAYGFYIMGEKLNRAYVEQDKDKSPKAKETFEEAYEQFQNAVDYYRRAISVARNPERTELLTRLAIEPKCWFEMGSCYLRMKHQYEAVVVFQAMRDTFLPDFRKKWLPDLTKAPYNKIAKSVKTMLDELDNPKNGLLARSGGTVLFALDENSKIHTDLWNKALKGRLLGDDITLLPGDNKILDPDYIQARSGMDEAKAFLDSAKIETNPKQAEESYAQAVQKYLAAAEKFKKVKADSPGYEFSQYWISSAYTQAQDLWAKGRFVSKPAAEQEAQSKDLAVKALEAIDKYNDFVAKTPAKADEDKERRAKIEGTLLLSRNSLYIGTQDWDKVIKTADEYIAWETKAEQQKSAADIAYLNKCRALLVVGGKTQPPDCEPFLKEAEVALREYRKIKKNDNRAFIYIQDELSKRYLVAAAQAEKLKLAPEVADGYKAKMADLQFKRVEMLEAENEDVSMGDYSRLVFLCNRVGQRNRAADIAIKLLKKFDPDNKNVKIEDDEKIWQEYLKKMIAVVKYDDLNKGDRCKHDHEILVDYMYETREGIANEKAPEKRPAFDKFNLDLNKAMDQLNTIKRNFPDCYTLNPKYGENGKAFLQIIEDEIDFRRKIEAARDLLSDIALDVADKLDKEGLKDQAKSYREIASKQIEILGTLRGDTPQTQIKNADIKILNGNFDEAVKILRDIYVKQDSESLLHFQARKKVSKVYAMQNNWREAAEFPIHLLVVMNAIETPRVKDNWPDIKDFLEECYKHGIARPAEPAKKTENPADVKPPVPDKPNEESKDKPKEEPKDDAKPEEKKKDDAAPAPKDK